MQRRKFSYLSVATALVGAATLCGCSTTYVTKTPAPTATITQSPAAVPAVATVTAPPAAVGSSIAAPTDVPSAFGGKGGGSSGGPAPGDDYPAQWRPPVAQDSKFDSWGEDNRECTSFVAWALHSRNGFDMPFNADAVNWGPYATARGFTVDTHPAVGAVAWETPGDHVAYVSEVSGATVTVEEYNENLQGTYDWRTVAATAFHYIHFKDLAGPPVAQAPPVVVVAPPVKPPTVVIQGAPGNPQGGTVTIQGGGTPTLQAAPTKVQAGPTNPQGGGGGLGGGSTPTPTPTPPTVVVVPIPPTPTPSPTPVYQTPTFTVMNTSETPPDGVWFRNSPHTADTDRATGHGVYSGDQVQLQCYASGDSVGTYADSLWYYVTNLTRPTVPGAGAPNVGYLNAHYINDSKAANVVDTGVRPC
jgi:surface antigen